MRRVVPCCGVLCRRGGGQIRGSIVYDDLKGSIPDTYIMWCATSASYVLGVVVMSDTCRTN
jgi:hypothetical protein